MRISQLAASAGVNVETVRYYQRIGLLAVHERPAHGFRAYDPTDLARLRFIRRAQALGFSLDDIAALLRLSARECGDVRAIAHGQLVQIREKLADLARMERALVTVLSRCDSRPQDGECPVIRALNDATYRGGHILCVAGTSRREKKV
jgi:MerR family transcriptional regulator, mercuric resistance operon regulatory protein